MWEQATFYNGSSSVFDKDASELIPLRGSNTGDDRRLRSIELKVNVCLAFLLRFLRWEPLFQPPRPSGGGKLRATLNGLPLNVYP
jgi:hypothetical protein